jgi:hypothetical protein
MCLDEFLNTDTCLPNSTSKSPEGKRVVKGNDATFIASAKNYVAALLADLLEPQ